MNLDERPRRARLLKHVHHERVRLKNLHAVGDRSRRVGAEHDELIRVKHKPNAEVGRAPPRACNLFDELFEHVSPQRIIREGEQPRSHAVEPETTRDAEVERPVQARKIRRIEFAQHAFLLDGIEL